MKYTRSVYTKEKQKCSVKTFLRGTQTKTKKTQFQKKKLSSENCTHDSSIVIVCDGMLLFSF